MSFSPIGNLDLGKFLQVIFTRGAMVQVSKSQREWEMISRMRDGNPNGRQRNFLFINSLGYAAAQSRNPNFSASFPAAQKASIAEYTALYKEFDVTVELEYNLWKAASLTPEKYAEPLAKEIELKSIVARRIMGTYLFGDGSGVFGTAASASDTTGAGGSVLVTLSSSSSARGHVRWFQFGDLFLCKNPDGTADNPTVVGSFYAWRVKDVKPKLNQVVLEAVDSSGNVLNLTASSIDASDLFYRVGQQVIPDLSGVIGDYGSLSDIMPGLESLVANDGRLVHGISMSGAAAGSVLDWNGAQLDVSALQEGLDEVDMRTGKGEFSYKLAVMSPEARAALIESREADRRFNSVDDTKRGGKGFGYVHDEDTIIFTPSEFCPKQRIYVLPEGKQDGNKVISYFGTDFEPVSDPMGNKFHLKPASAGGHERNIISYMSTRGTLVCHRPAAVLQIKNFSV
jgi:hypothetical protein